MTTVAALAVNGEVHMAADSLTNVYDRPIIDGARKIRRKLVGTGGGEALVAVCGDGGLADLIAYQLFLDAAPGVGEDLGPWAAAVAKAVTELAVEAGLTEGGRLDGTLLLGFRGRLWTLTHAQAIPIPDGVAALGSGEGPAMGAMDVLRATDTALADVVRAATVVAIGRDKHSAEPVYVESLTA